MSEEAVAETVHRELPREPLLVWLARNLLRLTLYLVLVSLLLALHPIVTEGSTEPLSYVGLAALYAAYGGVLGIPGTAAWLLMVAYVPPEWSTWRRRAVAVALSPLIEAYWLIFLASIGYWLAAAVFGIALPIGAAFVVRLRERKASSPWPPEGVTVA
jgi:drug/metabolite transporter superfamily protein YnfA